MRTIRADIIIAGGGLAGLTMAIECAKQPYFKDKKIIILDRSAKTQNDRTWCFWARNDASLPAATYRSWEKCRFYGADFERLLDIAPYSYHMVRGIDFYDWAKATLRQHDNILWVTADITRIDGLNGMVFTDQGIFEGEWILNSALRHEIDQKHPDERYTQLLQHFKGWVVQTDKPYFDPATVTFMDYRVAQKGDTRFVYVLPLSDTEALVEYTVFSAALCTDKEYDDALADYILHQLSIDHYRVKETEFGIIPMANIPLSLQEGRALNIGTAGGFVKGSSGYAFQRTQRKIKRFVADWAQKGRPNVQIMRSRWRFRFYDSVMLRVLQSRSVPGSRFFSQLFQLLPADLVFRFLDEDSTFVDDIRLMRAPPTWPFLKTALQQIPILRNI